MINSFSELSITSAGFFALAAIALGIYYLAPKGAQKTVLLAASYIFCISWGWNFAVVLFIFTAANYLIALKINSQTGGGRSRLLWFGILFNIGGLVFYKYFGHTQAYFFKAIELIGAAPGQFSYSLLQPIGISFYVLQAISYLVDVYRSQIGANRNFLEVSLYLAYFPKLLAGPIERAQNFFDQLRMERTVDNQLITTSLLRIFIGLSRKIIISNALLQVIPPEVFRNPGAYSFAETGYWWFVFAIMVYNDFAGYTSIARGVSGLFGIQLSPNFEQPFFSTSFLDFWNRWHISLSNWLRDYIYLPVSRALLRRNPSGRYLPNLIIPPLVTMIVSGLWHGAALHFILWGLLNGALQAWERVQKSMRKSSGVVKPTIPGTIAMIFILFLFNVPFKFDVAASIEFWSSILNWIPAQTFGTWASILKPPILIAMSFFIDVKSLPEKDDIGFLRLTPKRQLFLLSAGLFLLFLATRQQITAPFIYQEF